MIYAVRHISIFRYDPAIRESVMEARMQPRSEAHQRCISFDLDVDPSANIMQYRDFLGNTVHHFDIAQRHTQVKVTAQALVEVQPTPVPALADAGDWQALDAQIAAEDYWEMLLPSQFARSSEKLEEIAVELDCRRRGTPLELLMELNHAIYQSFAYVPNSTKVDSPIGEALEARQGVCQDFAHIMIALARRLRIPCRYVSGYLFHNQQDKDRSLEGASHAWVEALLPRLGWLPFDPTNNLVGGDRHIRVAIGRDYADVPPTRGVYKGEANTELSVSVLVSPSGRQPAEEITTTTVLRSGSAVVRKSARAQHEQQQQQ